MVVKQTLPNAIKTLYGENIVNKVAETSSAKCADSFHTECLSKINRKFLIQGKQIKKKSVTFITCYVEVTCFNTMIERKRDV